LVGMATDLDEELVRVGRLERAVAAVAELPWADLPVASVTDILKTLESVGRILPTVGYEAVSRLTQSPTAAGRPRPAGRATGRRPV